MTLLYYAPVFQQHLTGNHPENGGRTTAILQSLRASGLDKRCTQPSWSPATIDRLCYVHDRQYIKSVELFAEAGGGAIEADTVVSKQSYQAARMAAGAVCDAVERVVDKAEDKTAFCLVRPPGHHAMPDHAMGFCLFNNIAVGARVATNEFGLKRIMIVDFDVHHGNGTQAMFFDAPDVGFLSIHRSPFYPGTGAADEVGIGAGVGATVNLPIAYGTPSQQQLRIFESSLSEFAKKIRPELILVSAGFDSHKDDPIGSLGLVADDFRSITKIIINVAGEHADGRLVSVLEGGYNPNALSESVGIHLEELLGDSRKCH
ncbi:MAG: histone deacetylase [Planctomycetales bacterium]|nr:histone deacetylase [Planctomycetales bacterium]